MGNNSTLMDGDVLTRIAGKQLAPVFRQVSRRPSVCVVRVYELPRVADEFEDLFACHVMQYSDA